MNNSLKDQRNSRGQFVKGMRSSRNTRVTLMCPVCQTSFDVQQNRLKRAQTRICCSMSCAKTGIPSGRKGIPVPEETKKKISETCKKLVGPKASRWKGGRFYHEDGYVYIYCPDCSTRDSHGYILEHRLVMEKTLGRPLMSEEHVHHINGVKDDNRPENLMVMSNSEHLKLEWQNRDQNNFKNCVATQFKKGQTTWNKNPENAAEIRKARSSGKAKAWIKAVKERDSHICQICGKSEEVMVADHILPFAFFKDARYDTDNGRTLCQACHKKTDTFGTFSQADRDFYNNL